MPVIFHLIKLPQGVKIIEAVNGACPRERLELQQGNMILTEMNMPQLDGVGLINAVRGDLKRETAIIIATTG